jgi:O-glycosyl hydrolase
MTSSFKKFQFCAACLVCFCLAPGVRASEVQEFILDTSIHYQVMDNFGVNDAWSIQKVGAEWSETNKNKIADLLFSTNTGIGLSGWRFNLGAGINHQTIRDDWRTTESFETAPGKYDWTRQAGQRWFLRAAKAHGVNQFFATAYSPPLRLTKNGLSNLGHDASSTTNLKPGTENDFAKYLSDIIAHFRDNPDLTEQINFNFVLPVNEPQWEWQHGQEGCRYSNADLKNVYTVLHSRLVADGLKTKILGPESGSIPDMYAFDQAARDRWHNGYGNYLNWICGVPAVAACFGGVISYHSYWSDAMPGKLVSDREQLGKAFKHFPGWKIWQSEYCIMEPGRDLGMDTALRVARIIHCDLTLVNASSWQWWLAVANEDFKSGLIYTDYQKPGDAETIYESKLLWTLGNFSRFIRPGMVRVELSGPQDVQGLLASAYFNEPDKTAALVFVNCAYEAKNVRLRFAKSSDAERIFTTYITADEKNLEPGQKIIGKNIFTVPARSVVTLVSESGSNKKASQVSAALNYDKTIKN